MSEELEKLKRSLKEGNYSALKGNVDRDHAASESREIMDLKPSQKANPYLVVLLTIIVGLAFWLAYAVFNEDISEFESSQRSMKEWSKIRNLKLAIVSEPNSQIVAWENGLGHIEKQKIGSFDTLFVHDFNLVGRSKVELKSGQIVWVDTKDIDIINEDFYTIMIAAFENKIQAENYIEKLKEKGYIADLLYIPHYSSLSGRKMYAVFIGNFKEERQAKISKRDLGRVFRNCYGILVSNNKERYTF